MNINKIDYILDEGNVYIIRDDNEPGEIYGTYKNDKFTKWSFLNRNINILVATKVNFDVMNYCRSWTKKSTKRKG